MSVLNVCGRPSYASGNLHCVKNVHSRSYSVQMWENADQNNSEYRHFYAVPVKFFEVEIDENTRYVKQ